MIKTVLNYTCTYKIKRIVMYNKKCAISTKKCYKKDEIKNTLINARKGERRK